MGNLSHTSPVLGGTCDSVVIVCDRRDRLFVLLSFEDTPRVRTRKLSHLPNHCRRGVIGVELPEL